MDARVWFMGSAFLCLGALNVRANDAPDYRSTAAANCPQDGVDSHVREQFALYGPRSVDHEYFGIIFVLDGELKSAVVRGGRCGKSESCSVDTAKAAPLIPRGAKVLGEWHTHPHLSKARLLSADDVRGARNNRHIRCYAAYYSQPDGDIYAWNPFQTSVPTAMKSIVLIGNYRLEDSIAPGSTATDAARETRELTANGDGLEFAQ
jgi:hypothetical protein